jgi:hypothetical protein
LRRLRVIAAAVAAAAEDSTKLQVGQAHRCLRVIAQEHVACATKP